MAVYRRVILTTTVSLETDVHEQLELDVTVSLNLTLFDLTTPSDLSSASTRSTQTWTGSGGFAASRTASPHRDSGSYVGSAQGFRSMTGLTSDPACYCQSATANSATAISPFMSSKNNSLQGTGRLTPSMRASPAEFMGPASSNGDPWNSIGVVLVILGGAIFFDNLLLPIS